MTAIEINILGWNVLLCAHWALNAGLWACLIREHGWAGDADDSFASFDIGMLLAEFRLMLHRRSRA